MAGTRGMAVLAARGIELERDASFGVATGLFAAMLTAPPDRERARLLSGQASLAATLFDPAAPETGRLLGPCPRLVLADGQRRGRLTGRRSTVRPAD